MYVCCDSCDSCDNSIGCAGSRVTTSGIVRCDGAVDVVTAPAQNLRVSSERLADSEYISRMLKRLEEASEEGTESLVLAARAAAPLLERRAKLLGLDAPAASPGDGESVLDRMTREIAEQSARPKS